MYHIFPMSFGVEMSITGMRIGKGVKKSGKNVKQ